MLKGFYWKAYKVIKFEWKKKLFFIRLFQIALLKNTFAKLLSQMYILKIVLSKIINLIVLICPSSDSSEEEK